MRRTLTFALDDQARDRYPQVRFEVPDETRSVFVEVAVDDPDAVVDLGCEGPAGWRGWSGGARRYYFIGPDRATPGYLPGEIEPGEWAVVLGLHELPHGSATVDVTLAFDLDIPDVSERPAPIVHLPRGSARGLPAPHGLKWFAGDFHAHSWHSDGQLSIPELAAEASRSGLDFLAVTDHNTVSHHRLLPGISATHGISLLAGQEVTTHRGHANAFGEIPFVDFRSPADEWVRAVADHGGLLSVNHPTDGDCAWLHPLTKLPPAIEAFHSSWFRSLIATTTWAFLQRWDDVVLLGGSDFHTPTDGWHPGTPTTWVLAEDISPEAILAAAEDGRTSMSVGTRPDTTVDPFDSPLLLRLGDELVALGCDACVLVDLDGRRRVLAGDRVVVPGTWGRGPYRVEDERRRVLAVSR